MDLSTAINVIESVAGFTDADTAVGEAWATVLSRLNAAPVPVAVSERLPEPEDCDALGACWWYAEEYGWELQHREHPLSECTHWLPFSALPLPSGEAQP